MYLNQDENDVFEVKPVVNDYDGGCPGVVYRINGEGLEMTADQAEAFGIALILSAHKARQMNVGKT